MEATVVVPNYNRKDKLRECLESVFRQDYPRGSMEVIVIDDGSTDGSHRMLDLLCREHANLKFYVQDHAGPAVARNRGLRQATGDIVCFTDNDCIVNPAWVGTMVQAHRRNPDATAVGGLTRIDDQNIKSVVSQSLSDGAIQTEIDGAGKVIFFPTCNVSFKRSKINEYFNEHFPLPAGEDLEFFWRLFKNGHSFVCDTDVTIFHNCHTSFRSFLKQAYMYGRGNYLVQYMHRDHPLLHEIKPQGFARFATSLVVNIVKIPRFTYLQGTRLIESRKDLSFFQKFKVYVFFALHKVMYLVGNVLEHRRARKTGGALTQTRPEFIILDITHRCNLQCNVCEIRKDKPIEELTIGEVKNLIDQAISWGVPEFVLSGGEAFLREDIFEILEYIKERKYRVGVLTNGVILNDEFLGRLLPYLSSQVLSLSISLDALSAHIHDDIRGGAGCFAKTMRSLRRLSELKRAHPEVNFNTISIILNENLEELPALAHHLKELGVNSIQFQPLLANNLIMKERSERARYWIPPERLGVLDETVDKLIEFRGDNPGLVRNSENNLRLAKKYFRGMLSPEDVRCLYAARTVLIANNGDVTTCFQCYGNVKKQTLERIYASPEADRARQAARSCKSPCLLPCFCDN